MSRGVTRRDLLAGAAVLAGAGVVAGCAPAGPGRVVTRPTVRQHDARFWAARFDAEADDLDRREGALSRSTDSWDFYRLAYTVDAFTSMYEATGAETYADVALGYAENMIRTARPAAALATSSFTDTFRGWVSAQPDVSGEEVPLYESFCWRYVSRLLYDLHSGGGAARFGERYRTVARFCEIDMFGKWYARGPQDTIYRSRTHMTSHWAYLALHLSRFTPSPQVRDRCLDVVRRVDGGGIPGYRRPVSLRSQIVPVDDGSGAVVWSPVWGDDDPPQDVAHGNGDVAYVAAGHRLGAGWGRDDVAALSRTLLGPVLGVDGSYPEYVDGSGRGTGWVADGFVTLGRFDPACQAALEQHGVQNGQFVAAMAANAAILDGGPAGGGGS